MWTCASATVPTSRGWTADLDLAPGKRIAVLGPSGPGKSTLASVLFRSMTRMRTVTLDGADITDYPVDEVRRLISGCPRPAHFASTLRENLRLARPGADDAELWAARAARRRRHPRDHA